MIKFLYDIFFLPAAGLWLNKQAGKNEKMQLREKTWKDMANSLPPKNSRRIWVHAASMGEFEQAKPLIEMISKNYPEIEIIVSFFSPSGYENQKNYKFADHKLYMPIDKKENASFFVDKVDPDLVLFVRYELWINHFREIKSRNIPLILFCATKPGVDGIIEKISRPFYKKAFSYFDVIFTAGKEHTDYLHDLALKAQIVTSADTRIDRILEKVRSANDSFNFLKDFLKHDLVLLAGSTWPDDEEMIVSALKNHNDISVVFVPHEPDPAHIKALSTKIKDYVLLSDIEKHEHGCYSHIIVDSIGKLLLLYGIADLAYIGGGFGAGVHSVTEPAGYGLPLAAGKKINNSPDAPRLENAGALQVVVNSSEFSAWLDNMKIKNKYSKAAAAAKSYVESSRNATEFIFERIRKFIN
ncbi:MAG: 3-deoxy-D-manno-octulosonic acid transferase [Bacteroidota bacterium]